MWKNWEFIKNILQISQSENNSKFKYAKLRNLFEVLVFFAEFVYSRYCSSYFNFKNYICVTSQYFNAAQIYSIVCVLNFYATDTHKSDEML